jgi:hypothetical protein
MKPWKEFAPFLVIVGVGTLFYHLVEGFRWLDAFYFSVITLTTTGYGDLSPTSDLGKIFTVVYILVGFGVMLNFLNTFYLKRQDKKAGFKEKVKQGKNHSEG